MLDLMSTIASFRDGRALGAQEALAIRRIVYSDAFATQDEAQALIALNEQAAGYSPEWVMLFVEVMTDLIVYEQDPRGYVDEGQAAWLIEALARDGRIQRQAELEALIHILEVADAAPVKLSAFALAQVKSNAVANGAEISADDVAQMRRILYATSGEDGICVSREEAEALFDINDRVRGLANDPAWTEFFAKAVGSAILQARGLPGLDRAEAKRLQDWLAAPTPGVGGMLRGMAQSLAKRPFGRRGAAGEPDPDTLWALHNAAQDAAIAEAQMVTQAEASWIVERIGRDGKLDANEKALLAFIREQSPTMPEALRPLLVA